MLPVAPHWHFVRTDTVEPKVAVPFPIRMACTFHAQLVVCGVSIPFLHTCMVLHFYLYVPLESGGEETPPHPHLCVLLSLPSTHIRPRWSAHFRWWAPIPCCERLLCYLFSLVAIMSPAPPSLPLLGSLQLNRYKSGSFKLS